MMKRKFSVQRRWFLRLMLFVAALGLLGACAKKMTPAVPAPATWTPTAPARLTPEPAAARTPTGTPTPTSTHAPAPTSTSTPVPTPTPTPAATPFRPGPASKLGVFVGRNDPQLFELLRTGNLAVVKTLEYDANFVTEIKQIDGDLFLVARYTPLPLPDFDTWEPIAAAQAFVAHILPIATNPQRRAAIDCWEAYNEPVIDTPAQMASYAQFEGERTRLLAEHGIASCIGNFGVGQPDLALWPEFFPALQVAKAHHGFLALHEYSAPYLWFGSGAHQNDPAANEGDEGWLTLRYRKVYRQYLQPANLAIPLVITEMGIDGLVPHRPGDAAARGWREFIPFWHDEGAFARTPFGFYVEQLAWYDAELHKDDYVIGASIFVLAGPAGWESYEIGGPALSILRQYLSVHPPRQ